MPGKTVGFSLNGSNVYGGDGFWVQPDLTDSNIAYAESQGGDMGRINLTTYKTLNITPQAGKDEENLIYCI